jgi:acyl-CoA reductase-like NAD-dependent aldehyde dehydrogenase
MYQPLGIVGIIGPWNYPVQLTLGPLIGALAAGNRIMIKPSELTPRTSDLLAAIVRDVFAPEEVAVVQGGPDVAQDFSGLDFDHLFFTGSTRVGRQVMRAASENLVPVTLELGGKSPVLLAPDYAVAQAAERIAVGKLFNAGQTCIAPDYVLVPSAAQADFISAYTAAVGRFYPTLAENPDYTAIVNAAHFDRLSELVADAAERGASVYRINPAGEVLDKSQRKFAPVLLSQTPETARVLREEIFGPILPVVAYDDIEQALAYVNARPRPLAFYVFSNHGPSVDRALSATVSGGAAVNDTLLHCVQEELPFGGVGESGMGAYHGEAGFRTFSHAKSVFRQARFNGAALSRPPYGSRMRWLLRLILR